MKLLQGVVEERVRRGVEQHPKTYASVYEGAFFLQEEFHEFRDALYEHELDVTTAREELLDILVVAYRLLIDTLKFEDIIPYGENNNDAQSI